MNEFFTNEWTSTVEKLIFEVVSDPKTFLGTKYLPAVAMPAARIRTEVVEASGGMTLEHLPGTNPKYVSSFGTRVQEYQPPFYKEAIHYDEQKILYLRELGANGTNIRGVQQRMDLDIDRLNRRLETRIEKQRWDTIFNGGFSWGGRTLSFGIPSNNRAVPVGALWSTDGVLPNASANPIYDLQHWIMGGLSYFRKYNITGIVMNPNTARWILQNPNTRAYVTSFGANDAIKSFDLNNVLKFLVPGIPDVEVYKGWWQDETVDNATGRLSVGSTTYFIPDGLIYFETSLPGNDKIGEFVEGIHLASGTIASPGYGKFLVIDDCTGPGTAGGPKNPYVDIVSGVYGGVKLDRAMDVLTAKVIA